MPLTDFASRQPAAFIKGTVFDHDVTTSAEMLRLANLDNWDVRLREIVTDARSTRKAYEAVRTNPHDGGLDRLGIHGERYGEVQNEQAFGLFDELGVTWEAAGSFKNGGIVYGQARVNRTIVIDPQGVNDEVKPFLTIVTTHDGSGALTIGRDSLRLACFNQFKQMKGGLSSTVKIRHTLTVKDRIRKIRLAWKESLAHYDAIEQQANRLFQQRCTDRQYFAIVKQIVGERPEENKKGAQTKYDNSLEMYAQAWRGETNAAIYGTRYGAFQALIERNQWGRNIQKTESGLENFAMAGMGLDSATDAFRNRALDLVTSL